MASQTEYDFGYCHKHTRLITDEDIQAQLDTIHDWRALTGHGPNSWPEEFVKALITRIRKENNG